MRPNLLDPHSDTYLVKVPSGTCGELGRSSLAGGLESDPSDTKAKGVHGSSKNRMNQRPVVQFGVVG